MKRALLALVLAAAVLGDDTLGSAPARLQLEYVVVITRHGVRAPAWDANRLNQYSSEPWPDWGVPAAYLTPRGRTLMTLMGSYYGQWLSSEGVVNRRTCASARYIYIWADTDQRTRETARALADGLLPKCRIAVHALEGSEADPLFDPIDAGRAKPDMAVAAKAVRDRLGPDPQKIATEHRAAFGILHNILTGGASARNRPFESPGGTGVDIGDRSLELTGPLGTASTLSANLQLEYANGFTGRDLAWGRLNADNLLQVLELHSTYADLMRRTPYLARARGSNLLAHVRRSMEQAVTRKPVPGALGQPADRALFISGHDTNLSNISGMLGLSWHLPGYLTDDTPPGGALVFSLWRESAGKYLVKTQYVAATLDQMRRVAALTKAAPPAMQDVAIPGCGGTTRHNPCRWDSFERVLDRSIDPAFVQPD